MKNLTHKFKQWALKNKENLPNKKNDAFITILASKKEILSLLKEGFKIKAIYRFFVEMEKVSCSYDTFRIHVNKVLNEQLANNNNFNAKNSISNKQPKKKNEPKTDDLSPNNSSSIKRFKHSSIPDMSLITG